MCLALRTSLRAATAIHGLDYRRGGHPRQHAQDRPAHAADDGGGNPFRHHDGERRGIHRRYDMETAARGYSLFRERQSDGNPASESQR